LDKMIVTGLLVIAGVLSAVMAFNALFPAIAQSGDAMTGMERRLDDRLKSQVEIIHAARSGDTALVWAKNVGSSRLVGLASVDVFFGPEGNFTRIPYGSGTPHWEYTIENGTEWTPAATVKISIVNYTFSGPGTRYFVKVVLPNGVDDEYTFSD